MRDLADPESSVQRETTYADRVSTHAGKGFGTPLEVHHLEKLDAVRTMAFSLAVSSILAWIFFSGINMEGSGNFESRQ
jgi:hypothetical protein